MISPGLKEIIADLPPKPGIYMMKDNGDNIIYIGKAKNIKNRVSSYFTGEKDIKTRFLVSKTADLEIIITQNEYEALLLENNLIKRYRPRYNVNLKDGKTYPVIKLTNEPFPRVYRTRRIVFDGSTYFGPFPSAYQVDIYLDLINKIFPLRKCRGKIKNRDHPCLYYYMGQCSAPCFGKISEPDYNQTVDRVKKLLSGKTDDLMKDLNEKMKEASQTLQYEQAAKLRDQIQAIQDFSVVQKGTVINDEEADYIGYNILDQTATLAVFQVRSGRILGRESFRVEAYSDEKETIGQFIVQYYSHLKNSDMIQQIPKNIYLPTKIETDTLTTFLKELSNKNVSIKIPKKGRHFKIIKMAIENAREDMEWKEKPSISIHRLRLLQEVLDLPELPSRIEGFDIAHLSGTDTVASLVSFYNGSPDKSSYRHFKIKHLKGKIDDFKAIREVIARRYARVLNENLEKPDLIFIDGGRGQVSSVVSILDALDIGALPVVGLAKKNEELYFSGTQDKIKLDISSGALKLLQAVRDEAHRFANSFHEKIRGKRINLTLLEEINGIGEKRSRKLLQNFGSVEEIMKKEPIEIAKRTGVSLKLASRILSHLERRCNKERAQEPGNEIQL